MALRIPDLLTTANLSCGVASILLASQGQLTLACWLVFAGAAFDVLDGLAARALGGGSEFGKQLDSLADMVTFGVAPGMIAASDPYGAIQRMISVHRDFLPDASAVGGTVGLNWMQITTLMVIAIASCWRLAKFNIDTRQSTGFLGLATPANAIFWASVGSCAWGVGIIEGPGAHALQYPIGIFSTNPTMKLIVAVILGAFMLSEIPLPSLKFKHFKWNGNEVIFILFAIGLVLVLLYGILAVPLILLLYLLSPLWGKVFKNAETQKR